MKHATSSMIALIALAGVAPAAQAQTVFIGEVRPFAMNWCPRGFSEAAGQSLSIADWDALYSLYGVTYGGDGHTNFRLPDLRGRSPVGQGAGPGLSDYAWGQPAGVIQVTLSMSNLPPHNHFFVGSNSGPNTLGISGAALATFPEGQSAYGEPGNLDQVMHPDMVHLAGGGQPLDIRQPFIAASYCVALVGVYPPRN